MPPDNVFDRFRKNLARAADETGVSQDRIVDGVLFETGVSAKKPATSRTAPAESHKCLAVRKARARA